MDEFKLENEAAAFEEFWAWKGDEGIGEHEDDWLPWWECFLAGYNYATQPGNAADAKSRAAD